MSPLKGLGWWLLWRPTARKPSPWATGCRPPRRAHAASGRANLAPIGRGNVQTPDPRQDSHDIGGEKRHDVRPAKSVLEQTHFDGHVVHVEHLVTGGKKDYQPELALAGVQSAHRKPEGDLAGKACSTREGLVEFQ